MTTSKLYHQPTATIKPYPRLDGEPVHGLSSDYLVLTKTEGVIPDYDPQTELISPNWVVDLDNLEYRKEWVVNPIELQPNYDGFNTYMLTDATFKAYRDTVRPLDGELNSALFDAYGLVASNGVAAFSLVWGQWCSVSGITAEDREVIAAVAEGFSLPAEFVAVIRG